MAILRFTPGKTWSARPSLLGSNIRTEHFEQVLRLWLSEILILQMVDIAREGAEQNDCHVRVLYSHRMDEGRYISGLLNQTLEHRGVGVG